MIRKLKFILLFISMSVCLGLMSNTYSRYVAGTTGNIDALLSKWQIFVNNNDITDGTNSEITFSPVFDENEYVSSGTFAPTSKGYFDIEINPTNVDVSFNYTISLGVENRVIPDLLITKYSILPIDYVEGTPVEVIPLNSNVLSQNMLIDKDDEDFEFEPFTIRIYFEWIDGEGEEMDDVADTEVAARTETIKMNANIVFEQII